MFKKACLNDKFGHFVDAVSLNIKNFHNVMIKRSNRDRNLEKLLTSLKYKAFGCLCDNQNCLVFIIHTKNYAKGNTCMKWKYTIGIVLTSREVY